MVMQDDIPPAPYAELDSPCTWTQEGGEYRAIGTQSGHESPRVVERRGSPLPKQQYQAMLVQGADQQLALARPPSAAGTAVVGDDMVAPIQAVDEVTAGAHNPPPGASRETFTPLNELLWPGVEFAGGLPPCHHRVAPAPGVHDLADRDDGILHVDTLVDSGNLDSYLSAAGDFQESIEEAPASEDANRDLDMSFIDSDTDSAQDAANCEEEVVEQQMEDRGNNTDHDITEEIEVEDITDYTAQQPLDLNVINRMLTDLRHRGGDFEVDEMAEDELEFEEEGVAPVQGVQEVPVEGHLAEPLWKMQPSECPLKLLHVGASKSAHMAHCCSMMVSYM
jgi:hypothetical protein